MTKQSEMGKEPKDPTKLFNVIMVFALIAFLLIGYFFFNAGYGFLFGALIVFAFGITMYVLNRDKKK